MPQVATEAVVLHALAYSESSRIVRLATRDLGVVSALARGARRSRSRFGSALDLFAEGSAQLVVKEGRDLHTLAGFDVTHARPALGDDLDRFTGAAMLSELAIRFGTEDPGLELFDTLIDALDALVAATPSGARTTAAAGAWRMLEALGFAPALDACARCHATVPPDENAPFSHAAGGVLCASCAARGDTTRHLPASAREALAGWLAGHHATGLPLADARAHQRLLREFLQHHLDDGRPLRAFIAWEHGDWSLR